MNLFQKLGGRKLIFMLLAVSVGVIVDLKTANGLSSNLKDLLIYVGAIYTLGNVGTKAAEAVKAKSSKDSQLKLDEVIAAIQQLNNNQNELYTSLNANNQATGEILKRVVNRTE